MRLEDMNWLDVESYLKQDDRLMLILGACEQHGYLSILTDVKIPLALADAASKETGVLIAPALNFGVSPYHLAYPGTISLRVTTLLEIVEDIVQSAFSHGFRRILVLNGHEGNESACGRLYELANRLPELRLAWYAWWHSNSVEAVARKHDLRLSHAGWAEAFPFTKVGELPQGLKTPPHIANLLSADESRQKYGDGVFGGQYQVDERITQEIFMAAYQDIIQMLRFE
jgi:creatinine amidohydrolase